MEGTVPPRDSKRKAREERLLEFQALADFANMGDKPDDWRKFRLKCPHFFRDLLGLYIYRSAEEWSRMAKLPDTDPESIYEYKYNNYYLPPNGRDSPDFKKYDFVPIRVRDTRPPLLLWRNFLRAVWRRRDEDGWYLRCLLNGKIDPIFLYRTKGLELFTWPRNDDTSQYIGRPRIKIKETETSGGLPLGNPDVQGSESIISLEFGCLFQRAISYLMQERWRAKICSWSKCHKYFVADKGAQKYCSEKCYWERKLEQSLDYYHRFGKARRQKPKAPKTRAHAKKS